MRILPIRKRLVAQVKEFGSMQLLKPKDLQEQGTHNSPQLWHSRVVRNSNFTFGEYLVSTILMLFVRSSLFIVQVLS